METYPNLFLGTLKELKKNFINYFGILTAQYSIPVQKLRVQQISYLRTHLEKEKFNLKDKHAEAKINLLLEKFFLQSNVSYPSILHLRIEGLRFVFENSRDIKKYYTTLNNNRRLRKEAREKEERRLRDHCKGVVELFEATYGYTPSEDIVDKVNEELQKREEKKLRSFVSKRVREKEAEQLRLGFI
jgi:hypothetical protein